jgi:parvulin-like peptidyl-prolyl isomerase
MMKSVAVLLLVAAASAAGSACSPTSTPAGAPATAPPDTWAVVDGRAITRDEVEKAFRRQAGPQRTEEETLAAKLGLLNEMIVQELILGKAAALKVTLTDTEVDNAFAEAKKGIADADFEKELTSRQLTAADMRESLRRDLLANKVIEQEVTAKVAVTDQEVAAFFEANRAQFNRPEDAYHIGQITVTPVREPQQTNRTGNDAATPEQAQAKAAMLMERLKGGASFAELAADFSEDAETSQRGGDLGYVPVSALRQVPAPLRDAVLQTQPGNVRMVSVGGGHTIVLVVARDTAGQKDLSMPQVKEAITSTLRGHREQLLRAAYVNALRNDAAVRNYLADRLVAAQGKAVSLAPAAPGAQ